MFEKFLHQTPFVRFVFPLIAGILLKIFFPGFSVPFVELSIALLLLIVGMEVTKQSFKIRVNKVFGVLVFLSFLITGAALVQYKSDNKTNLPDGKYSYTAIVIENPEIKEKTIKAIIEIIRIKDLQLEFSNNPKVLVYFQKDSSSTSLKMGDLIMARSQVSEIRHSGNPNVFNYKNYLSFKEIYYQTYLNTDQFSVVDRDRGNKLLLMANNVRQLLLNQYQKYKISGDQLAVISALTLGYKADLSPEVKQSFSASGAMHVLAVSGLHVGIIFFIISNLLFFLERKKYGRLLRFFLVIGALFSYALLTGLSNSVLRSTFMFSLICVGDIFARQKNTYNTIAASAFILLLINPLSIMDVGFQLSYLAVLSIVFFQPRIYSLFKLNSYLPDKIWQLVSVSVAAQIGTFPLTLFYFHQFPVYFIITNIFVIPLSLIVICSAVALLIFSFSGTVAGFIAYLLEVQLKVLNGSIKVVENLPFSTITAINIDQTETFLFFAIIIVLALFIISKRLSFLKYAFLIFIITILYNTVRIHSANNESGIIVYNIAKTSAIEFYSGNTNKIIVNSEKEEIDDIIKFNFQPFWDKQGIENPEIVHSSKHSQSKLWNVYHYNNLTIVQLLSDKIKLYNTKTPINIDYLVLSKNSNISISDLQKYFNFKKLIIDSSNQLYRINKWKKECEMIGVEYFSVTDNGAFIVKQPHIYKSSV
ncbi:MAG: hypothetical protein A2W99_13080 [Bacteroidetes bacterium GWF2_33_16]|nr:MAG: hypothetical protein A2X00_01195 [Bacteroidetes bacterium GWE2_32_14]OFY06613.1 MAG: hypothetical protein A2W99_13080 [Bacteroidetes bacterium GWF2_33_16]